jgi:hypothetical protein
MDITTNSLLVVCDTKFNMCEQFFNTSCHIYKKASFITPSWIKQLGWYGIHIILHFTSHTMEIYDMEFEYYHKIRKY